MSTVKVAILVITKQRPRMLAQLLDSLAGQRFAGAAPELEVVVVDNDPEGSARETCQQAKQSLPWPIRFEVESRAGIPFARNRAIASTGEGCDFVAFIDDDEIAEPNWLDELLIVQARCGADAVAGPVESILPDDAPDWATRGKIFDHDRHRTGEPILTTGTGNVLISTHVFDKLSPWFDERMALTGGSDRHFFLRMHDAGLTLVWADDARVREDVPASRVELPWVLKRMYRQGICNAFCEVDLQRSRLPRAQMAARGAAFIAAGLGLAPLGLVTGSHKLLHYARYVAYGAGMLQGARGHLYDEYRQIHGS